MVVSCRICGLFSRVLPNIDPVGWLWQGPDVSYQYRTVVATFGFFGRIYVAFDGDVRLLEVLACSIQ